ncbi:hypothetical protein PBY51_009059 [Eleginops maclovinus]|uniref:Nuclear protein MDM1 n=1 Tax=Eleginops maclovinus TaxID=56733 RepID=A0AAN7WYC0_ELEMC|nr:hypothetical protein PBY51_009059 [Eleginops maclovinus]
MTVRFKCRSEYQKRRTTGSPAPGVSLLSAASRWPACAQTRWTPSTLGALRTARICREPCFQRRRRFAQSCSSLLCPPDPRADHKTAPPAASRSRSAPRKEPNIPTPGADPGPPAAPPLAADPRPSGEPAGEPAKHRLLKADSQSQPSQPDGQQPAANEVNHALRWRAGLRSGGQRSEYHRQFSWKKSAAAASPILTAEQVLHSSRSVPPFKKHSVPLETEYRRSFLGLAPPPEPRLQKHLQHHTHKTNKKSREEPERKPRPKQDISSPHKQDAPPLLLLLRCTEDTEIQSSFRSLLCRIPERNGPLDSDPRQVEALRRQALAYRRRAWGSNFCRDHLSQLLSDHNALWEAADTTSDPSTPHHLTSDPPHSHCSTPVEALDLNSNSSQRSSGTTPRSPDRRSAWGEEEEEETDEEEGRLPTPRLKIRPTQRTHHDLTTPATGGAILVGKPRSGDKQMCGSSVSMAAGAETAVAVPITPKEAWSEHNSVHSKSSAHSPDNRPPVSPASKPIRTKQNSPPPAAPPPLVPPPQHYIQGTLRTADFQHNGGCCHEDDRLSVMSWRSAASCSAASAVLQRAQRRESFWGKR